MSDSFDTYAHGVMSGSNRSPGAVALRAVACVAEPFYTGAMRVRNALYDAGIFKTHKLSRPVISVGNLTTGGTGKTPVVCWIVQQLRDKGFHPAVLLRGYKSTANRPSDEAILIDDIVNAGAPAHWRVPVIANANRVAGAKLALARIPEIDVFVLDDAFQHRRVYRDFNLLLLDATNADGYGHVLPRGLLREPFGGMIRADAVLITRCPESPDRWSPVAQLVPHFHPTAAVYRCNFKLVSDAPESAGRKVLAFCGIGNPQAFFEQVESAGMVAIDREAFNDHYAYTIEDVRILQRRAQLAGAEALVTTRKDWMKIESLGADRRLRIIPLGQTIQFHDDHALKLLAQIEAAIGPVSQGKSATVPSPDTAAR